MQVCTLCNIEKQIRDFDETRKGSGRYRKICRKCRNEKSRKNYLSNPKNVEKMKLYQRVYQKKHKKQNVYYRIYCSALSKIKNDLRKRDSQLKKHLESLFTEDMSWENYGTYWEIDHIISATKMAKAGYSIEEINKLSNLRPLTIKQNQERKRL